MDALDAVPSLQGLEPLMSVADLADYLGVPIAPV